jgi:hypothetical protein
MAHAMRAEMRWPTNPRRRVPRRQKPRHFRNQGKGDRDIGDGLFIRADVFGFDGVYQQGGWGCGF